MHLVTNDTCMKTKEIILQLACYPLNSRFVVSFITFWTSYALRKTVRAQVHA